MKKCKLNKSEIQFLIYPIGKKLERALIFRVIGVIEKCAIITQHRSGS